MRSRVAKLSSSSAGFSFVKDKMIVKEKLRQFNRKVKKVEKLSRSMRDLVQYLITFFFEKFPHFIRQL